MQTARADLRLDKRACRIAAQFDKHLPPGDLAVGPRDDDAAIRHQTCDEIGRNLIKPGVDQDAVERTGRRGNAQTVGEDDLDILLAQPLEPQARGDRQSLKPLNGDDLRADLARIAVA